MITELSSWLAILFGVMVVLALVALLLSVALSADKRKQVHRWLAKRFVI